MDLRFCPACNQSVLDDDATDCPFCGASMSGKPGAAAPPKKSGGAPKVKGKAGRGKVAAKSRRLVNKGKTAVKKGCEWRC